MTTIKIDLPADVDAHAAEETVLMLAAHRGVLTALARTLSTQRPTVEPAILAQLGRAESLWRHIEDTWGLLSPQEVTRLTGGNPAKATSHVTNLRRRKHLLGEMRGGALHYPGFQFTGTEVDATWQQVASLLLDGGWSSRDVLMWAASPTAWLDGQRPADLLASSPDAVLEVTRTVAEGTATG